MTRGDYHNLTMVRQTDYGPKWDQEDYDFIKKTIEDIDGVEFNGSENGHGDVDQPSIGFDIGDGMDVGDFTKLTVKVADAFVQAGMNVCNAKVKAGYRGATDQCLILEIEFEEQVYKDWECDECNARKPIVGGDN